MKNPEIKTKKLIIRPLSYEELEELCKSVTDAEEKKAYGEMLEGCRSHHVNRLWYTAWEISLRDTGERVGDMCFKGTPENNETEIGYGIDEQHRNKGYASEAVKALTEWAFSNSGELYFVTAQADPENTASIRVLQKNGFVPAGRGDAGPLFASRRPTVSCLYFCASAWGSDFASEARLTTLRLECVLECVSVWRSVRRLIQVTEKSVFR